MMKINRSLPLLSRSEFPIQRLLLPRCASEQLKPRRVVPSAVAARQSHRALSSTTISSTGVDISAAAAAHVMGGGVGRQGHQYILTPKQITDYHKNGYIVLKGVITEDELRPIEDIYMKFMRHDVKSMRKDFCDMSGDFDRSYEEFSIVNAMLPRVYDPNLCGNIFERRAASITHQLFNDNHFAIDYDQFLAKKPSKGDAVFPWHVDLAYWPLTPDTRTATFSLALDPTTKQNGCLRFVVGSHLEPTIRLHKPISAGREKAHAIVCEVNERTGENSAGEVVSYCEIGRGDVTIHNERVVHGSGGNYTQGWRRTYVLAFRHQSTIDIERSAGFTHSHNDAVDSVWTVFDDWHRNGKLAA